MKFFRTLVVLSLFTSANLYATTKLRFIGDINFATGEKFQETEIGGLSGIVYDQELKRLIAVSDDKSQVNETRFYEFDIALNEKSFVVKPAAVVKLKKADGNFYKKGEADFEGITMIGKDLLISSEGAINRSRPTPPELIRFSRTGELKELLPISQKFLLPPKDQADKLFGSRDNKAFESLSTTIDGKTTFLASEEALFQDGPISTIENGSHVRIILYKGLKPAKEVAYQLEKVEALKTVDLSTPENGLVDIAAIDEHNFFTMERSWLPFLNKNVIRIFKSSIDDKTTDVTKLETLKDASFIGVKKELVADLDDFLIDMNPKVLDNIEGIALGPVLANGNRTLIVVSDNNFGKGQRTLFMAFELLTK